MAIRMPGPVALGAHRVFHLNVRVPKDLAAKLRGAAVTLPVDGGDVTVKIGDKVVVSLRTKDRVQAKLRFQHAAARLDAFFTAMRAAPEALSYKDIVALSGEAYRGVADRENEVGPDYFDESGAAFEAEVRSFRCDGETVLSREDGEFLATLALFEGPALLAWTRGGLDFGCLTMSEEEGLERLFGRQADAIVAKRGLCLDHASRIALLREIGRTLLLGTQRLQQVSAGDFSPDPHLARFPKFGGGEKVDVAELFIRWKAHNADKVEASTIRRYTPTLNRLAAFLAQKDVRRIDEDDIWAWAEHRRDVDKIAARTVNRNDLVAASSVFAFAASRDGKRLITVNPVKGVKLDAPKAKKLRERSFRAAEIKAILNLARNAEIKRSYPKASASRRWVPWICAYLGARVQEPCWLEKKHFRMEDGIWVVGYPRTKDGNARVVPLHDALIDEGLVAFVEAAPDGLLFVGDKARSGTPDRTIQEVRASELAAWIQDNIDLEDGVDPNHGWRHTWISIASSVSVNISKRHQNAITGHNKNKDASDGYCAFPLRELKVALDKFPQYAI